MEKRDHKPTNLKLSNNNMFRYTKLSTRYVIYSWKLKAITVSFRCAKNKNVNTFYNVAVYNFIKSNIIVNVGENNSESFILL